ncbi:hypothetical protein L2E82_37105 [Cichorium intybus]|uniref:Uncharacterized protein n=1 Tax=Cichorium intybus TaxID=13427 RepID=A0ACB9AEY0_CICIN|nr:hypothetical protein L2E82_37105 [Cichorium intybus]
MQRGGCARKRKHDLDTAHRQRSREGRLWRRLNPPKPPKTKRCVKVNGVYEARDPRMKRYVETVNNMAKLFDKFTIRQIARSENRRADTLSKLASTSFDHLTKKVLVEVLKEQSIDETQVKEIATEGTAWMTPIIDYIRHRILLKDDGEAKKIRIKAPQYSIMDGRLYNKGYIVPWLKCITSQEGQEML